MCHGFDGIPMMRGTPNFANGERLEETDNQLLESIRKGKGIMPSWAKILDEQERAVVLAYTRMIPGDGLFFGALRKLSQPDRASAGRQDSEESREAEHP
jgi:hypothetical protein